MNQDCINISKKWFERLIANPFQSKSRTEWPDAMQMIQLVVTVALGAIPAGWGLTPTVV
jgi:hypothetical protein